MKPISFKHKKIGHRTTYTPSMPVSMRFREADALQKTVQALRGSDKVCKRGLYKFRTFEEADEWMETMILASIQESPR